MFCFLSRLAENFAFLMISLSRLGGAETEWKSHWQLFCCRGPVKDLSVFVFESRAHTRDEDTSERMLTKEVKFFLLEIQNFPLAHDSWGIRRSNIFFRYRANENVVRTRDEPTKRAFDEEKDMNNVRKSWRNRRNYEKSKISGYGGLRRSKKRLFSFNNILITPLSILITAR